MSFKEFSRRIKALVVSTGDKMLYDIFTDKESGRHYARFSDGTTIIGNSSCIRVSVNWGSGHHALAKI